MKEGTPPTTQRETRHLLERIDCAESHPPSKYFETGDSRIVESNAGNYREAGVASFSRFGYKFSVHSPGKPHAVVIRYPDDKRRFMCIMDGTSYDLTTGVLTGFTQPVSGIMESIEIIFWPRWPDCSIVFMTYGEGEPAAVASVEISEMDGLQPLDIPGRPRTGRGRELGIQYEDPCGTAASEGATTHAEWVERVIDYARYTGQRLLVYPMVWYHGPMFPSRREPADGMDLVVAKDAARTQYTRWVTDPPDWYAALLDRFGQEGLEFQGALTLLRLGSLMSRMNVNRLSIMKGKETYNNMLWNDHVQAATRDWTAIHNAINYNAIAKRLKTGKVVRGFRLPFGRKYAYGEHSHGAYHAGPMFNPLHPVVQEAVLGFVGEIASRYSKYPAFTGITLNMYATTFLWFGTIHSGYDDYTASLFEKETGIKIPVRNNDWRRFSKRYEYLTFTCREAWIGWRCRKIRDLMRKVRDVLVAARPDMRLTINLWDETFLMPIYGNINASHQIFARKSTHELFREAGIDVALYKDEPGIGIDMTTGCTRDRGGHGKSPAGGINLPPEATSMYRDFDFLDDDTTEAFHDRSAPGAFLFNCWVEAWGEHVWQQCDPADPNLPALADMDGKKAEGILHINSRYPPDGFWWESQLRIVPTMLGGIHFMEPYAHAVAEYDAVRITRGGLFLDKTHATSIQQFARAFQALPAERFSTVGTSTDPVAVRTLVRGDVRYVYAVNREYYPVTATITIDKAASAVRSLGTDEMTGWRAQHDVVLGPYELQAFSMPASVSLLGVSASIPREVEDKLLADANNATAVLARVRTSGAHVPGTDELIKGIERAIETRRFAWLRRALSCYVVRKCQLLDKEPADSK